MSENHAHPFEPWGRLYGSSAHRHSELTGCLLGRLGEETLQVSDPRKTGRNLGLSNIPGYFRL